MSTDRQALINSIYYQELDRVVPDQAGSEYWMSREDLDDDALRLAIRNAGGKRGESVTAPLLADNQFSAWMRGQQMNESTIQSNLQAAQEAANRRIHGQAGIYDRQRKQSERSTNQGYESRGMYRSGGRLNKVHDNRLGIDLQQRQFEDGINESKAQMERDAGSKVGDIRRQRAEQELGARDRLTQRSVEAGQV
jgi:hypothetical protein